MMRLHAENAKDRLVDRTIEGCRNRKGEYLARVGGIDYAVVPQPGAGVVGVAFALVLLTYGSLECKLFIAAPAPAIRFDRIAADGGEHRRRLLPAHHRDARVRPHPQEPRSERSAAHAVIAGSVTASDDHRELGNLGARHRGHHLGTILGNAASFVFLTNHESGDVLQEDERYAALAAKLDKVCAFERRFRIEHA